MMTINLPVGTIKTIINIDDPKINVPIEKVCEDMMKGEDKYIRTLDANYEYVNKEINGKVYKTIELNTFPSFINKIKKQNIVNNPNMKYFNVSIVFEDGHEETMIVPNYVKFFSKITKSFVNVESMGKAETVIDWQGKFARIKGYEEIDFVPTEYYNIVINPSTESQSAFYYNGIYSYVYYINFFRDFNKENKENKEARENKE